MASSIKARQRGLTREASYEDFKRIQPSDFELKWGQGLGAQEALDRLGLDFITPTLQAINGFVTATELILDLVAGVLDFILDIISLAAFEFANLAVLIRETLEEVINLFTGVSMHALTHFPTTYKQRRNPNEILYDVGMAYLDKKDSNRPITVSSVDGISLVFVFSLPNLEALIEKFEAISKAFKGFNTDIEDFSSDLHTRFKSIDESYRSEEFLQKKEGSTGMAPDFFVSVDLEDIVGVKGVVSTLTNMLGFVEKSKTAADKVRATIESAQRRIQALGVLVDNVSTAINSAANFLAIGEGSMALLSSGTGTAEDFARAIINAPLHPEYPRSEFFEEQADIYKRNGLQAPLNRDLAIQSVFSGAVLLHFQAPDVTGALSRLRTIANLLYKDAPARFNQTVSRDAASERFDGTIDQLQALGN